ncbi:unnamed protein product [Coffea canephora]|uniref:Uncharacterized protein n=1 Tax=Coffea canephora TaxID=49390 RepID=A0A068UME8_COFCA|nr:unnamed protein product [Coffea canephora]
MFNAKSHSSPFYTGVYVIKVEISVIRDFRIIFSFALAHCFLNSIIFLVNKKKKKMRKTGKSKETMHMEKKPFV